MDGDIIAMSANEREQAAVMLRLPAREVGQRRAGALLGLEMRQGGDGGRTGCHDVAVRLECEPKRYQHSIVVVHDCHESHARTDAT